MLARLTIPRRLTISGRTWRVVHRKRLVVDGAPSWAATDRATRIIELEDGMAPALAEAKFLHECLHAAWPLGLVEPEKEETLIGLLEEPLLDVVRAMARRTR